MYFGLFEADLACGISINVNGNSILGDKIRFRLLIAFEMDIFYIFIVYAIYIS
jgi:hypothetical protein